MANLSLLQQFKLLCLGNVLKEPSFLKVDKKLKKDATYVPAFYKQPNVFKSYAFSEPEFIFEWSIIAYYQRFTKSGNTRT